MLVASIRPSEWNWLLLFHLLFAFALVGGVFAVTLLSLAARRAAGLEPAVHGPEDFGRWDHAHVVPPGVDRT